MKDSRVARMQSVDACNERGALAACNEREELELQEALLISQAHHHEVIYSASRLSICEQEELDAAISNSKAESLIVDALIQFDQECPDANNIQHQGEIKIAAFEVYNNVETPLKNMNRGAGRLQTANSVLRLHGSIHN